MTKNITKLHIDLSPLSLMQRMVILTLLESDHMTYQGIGKRLGVHVGTVYQHLKRVRDKHPEVYNAVMEKRRQQLFRRHIKALAKAKAHSRAYFRRKRNWEYKEKYGYYPWERW